MTPIEALKKIAENPYPINIFPPLTKSEWNYIKEALNVAEDEISLDRLSADIARKVRKNDIAIATEALASYRGGEDLEQKIEQYKKICRMADVPELIIENPFFINGEKATEADMAWAKKEIEKHLKNNL